MALIHINLNSKCLMRTVEVTAVIPFDKILEGETDKEKYKTLYLLHGIFGNNDDWVTYSNVRRWAEKKNLAVIMPSGENHFYVDCEANGERFSEFIGKELPEMMERLFPLSDKREDRFIGGLSMGGYGAVSNGLKYYKSFSKVIGLSGALDRGSKAMKPSGATGHFGPYYFETLFGKNPEGTDKDIFYLLDKVSKEEDKPDLYICCGTEDSLISVNRDFAGKAKEKGYNVEYHESEGGHTWDFWNEYIEKIIMDYLPLEEVDIGITSGNVGVIKK
ncbi:MAG: alpha/beta hydrolase family protein [Erysipelotrichaceae bacterium]|nr:alpha/beta hydrolase family protein [Erysipelotrichaceae bacterium]